MTVRVLNNDAFKYFNYGKYTAIVRTPICDIYIFLASEYAFIGELLSLTNGRSREKILVEQRSETGISKLKVHTL